MTDFKYTGKVDAENSANFKIRKNGEFEVGEVKDIKFLTPVNITMELNGKEETIIANVDLISKTLFLDDWICKDTALKIEEVVFKYLNKKNYMDPHSFESKEALAELAKRMGEMTDIESRRYNGS